MFSAFEMFICLLLPAHLYLYCMFVNRWMIRCWNPSWALVSSQLSTTWWHSNFHQGITHRQSAAPAAIYWCTGVTVPLAGFTCLHWLTKLVTLWNVINYVHRVMYRTFCLLSKSNRISSIKKVRPTNLLVVCISNY